MKYKRWFPFSSASTDSLSFGTPRHKEAQSEEEHTGPCLWMMKWPAVCQSCPPVGLWPVPPQAPPPDTLLTITKLKSSIMQFTVHLTLLPYWRKHNFCTPDCKLVKCLCACKLNYRLVHNWAKNIHCGLPINSCVDMYKRTSHSLVKCLNQLARGSFTSW